MICNFEQNFGANIFSHTGLLLIEFYSQFRYLQTLSRFLKL